jgi:hypothetical protein
MVQAHHLPHLTQQLRRFALTVHPVPSILLLKHEPDIAAGQEGAETPPISRYPVKLTC